MLFVKIVKVVADGLPSLPPVLPTSSACFKHHPNSIAPTSHPWLPLTTALPAALTTSLTLSTLARLSALIVPWLLLSILL